MEISISEMGPKNKSSFQSHNYFHKLSKALEFAVSEWMLMFLLFIDACFTYLITKFASYCQLQSPCLLCSRFDHIQAKDKTGIYWDSICNHHISEISSAVLCNVHGICENCLSSFATKTKNKLNDETFKLLVENLGSKTLIEDHIRDYSGSRICFCCNKQYVLRDYAKNMLPESLIANGERAKDEKNIFVDMGKNQIACSSDVEYKKADINSDNGCGHDLIPDVNLKPVSQFEVVDLHHDLANVASRDTEELKWRDGGNNAETQADAFLETTHPPRTNDVIKEPPTENDESAITNGHQMLNYSDLGDAYKLAMATKEPPKGSQLSGKLLDQKSFKDSSTRVNEDLKNLLSHRSNDTTISPKLSFNSDELTGMQFFQRRISLERNESNLSFDGSVVGEIDGENMVDGLKRQVEHDKKVMGILYKELEEERNASAVATNQAMAMITRLQEEKAALYTEALQCLRVMEEQAEYNNEALQKANDLIEEKDKQIQELDEILRNTSEDVVRESTTHDPM